MEFYVLQEYLKDGLSIVGPAAAKASSLPVLSCVYLQAEGERLSLFANNLELSIKHHIPAKIEQPGAVALPYKLLVSLVDLLPAERIGFDVDPTTGTAKIECSTYRTEVKGYNGDEFPLPPDLPETAPLNMESSILTEIIKQVVIAAAVDSARPILTGILVEINESKLVMVAADGFRMSVCTSNGLPQMDPQSLIVPARTLSVVSKLIREREIESVALYLNPNRLRHVTFDLAGTTVFSQVIEGNFPDYSQIMPSHSTARLIIDTDSLRKAVQVNRLFARSSTGAVKLTVQDGLLTLEATAAETGNSLAQIPVQVEGEPIPIAFSANYMANYLDVVQSAQTSIEITTSGQAGLFRPIGDDAFTHLIMPMNLS